MSSMYDTGLIADIFDNVDWSFAQIAKRLEGIESSEDLVKDDIGLGKLDSICMQLINIGEALKHVDKLTDGKLLATYPGIDWKKAMGVRDIIAHHYFDIDHETVYFVCKEHVPEMKEAIKKVLDNLKRR